MTTGRKPTLTRVYYATRAGAWWHVERRALGGGAYVFVGRVRSKPRVEALVREDVAGVRQQLANLGRRVRVRSRLQWPE